jgi:hypothetical protein
MRMTITPSAIAAATDFKETFKEIKVAETINQEKPKSKRGGARAHAGRKPGTKKLPAGLFVRQNMIVLGDEARKHAVHAVNTLVHLMNGWQDEPAAALGAAKEILNRGYGQAPLNISAEVSVRGPEWWAKRLAEMSQADIIDVVPTMRFIDQAKQEEDDGGQKG